MAQTDVAGTRSSGGQAKQQAQQVTDQAQEKAQQGAAQAKERIREQVDQRSTTAGDQVVGAAGDARSVADELRKQGKDTPARYAEQAADRAERFGSYLRDADGDRILRDAEDLGRKNPWGVVAGGLALGFLASRFLKASSSERYRSTAAQPRRLDAGSPAPSQPAPRPPVGAQSGDGGKHP